MAWSPSTAAGPSGEQGRPGRAANVDLPTYTDHPRNLFALFAGEDHPIRRYEVVTDSPNMDYVARQRYQLQSMQLGAVDRLVGGMIDHLSEVGAWDDRLHLRRAAVAGRPALVGFETDAFPVGEPSAHTWELDDADLLDDDLPTDDGQVPYLLVGRCRVPIAGPIAGAFYRCSN